MKRPKPTKQLMSELCGDNQGLISGVHHGLYETPSLSRVYPNLNLDELVAFTASSWGSRSKNTFYDSNLMSVYELFCEVFAIGFPWLNKHKHISPTLRQKYEALNPFKVNLKKRLERVDPKAISLLRRELQAKVNEYVFDCQYTQRKQLRDGDNHKLIVMNFQNAYPKSGRIVPAYASEVVRIISSYPSEYEPLDEKATSPAEPVKPKEEQLEIF